MVRNLRFPHRSPVSTHSRAEAAAHLLISPGPDVPRFNTQPRGGGCIQPNLILVPTNLVSTHSRAEAAAIFTR